MAARLLSAAVALVGIGGAAALFVSSAPRQPPVDGPALAADLDGRLREAAAGLRSRTSTLAELPRLQSAVSTDAATVRDLTGEELAFRPRPGETITIGQVPARGAPTVLLEIPAGARAGAAPIALGRPGLSLSVSGDRLRLTAVVSVQPKERSDELHGAVAVSWPVDVQPIAAQLAQAGTGARLEVGGASLALGAVLPSGAPVTSLPLSGEAGAGAVLVVQGGVAAGPLRPLSALVALMGLVAATLLYRAGRPANAPRFVERASSASSASSAATPAPTPTPTPMPDAGATGRTPSTARQIGRYLVLKQLGSGGMAEVYLARATGEAGFEKLLALKVMHRSMAKQPEIVEHFLDEAKLASRLTHPNIVQITDLGRVGDDYFIAMEYIDGADLERLLTSSRARSAPVPLRVALAIVRKICDGLHAAHIATNDDGKSLDIVHRDVKSANVFIAKNGAVKVGDFGIAKANELSRVKKTDVGMVKGTREYMAPEHRLGEDVDRRADLYAVGAIAYELLSGAAINLDLALLGVRGIPGWPHLPRLTEARPELPAELDAVITKALAYHRDQRFTDCAAFEEALDAIATRHGLVAGDKVIAQWVEAELAAEAQTARAAG